MALIDNTKIRQRLDVADVNKNMGQYKMFRLKHGEKNGRKVKNIQGL